MAGHLVWRLVLDGTRLRGPCAIRLSFWRMFREVCAGWFMGLDLELWTDKNAN